MTTITRRRMLLGGGMALGLPFLESMPMQLHAGEATGAGDARPVRLVCIYVGNGVVNESWYPTTTGPSYELTPILTPLAKVKQEVSVLAGLHNRGVPGDHSCTPYWLTGVHKGISLDQAVAAAYGRATRFASLTLGSNKPKNLLSFNKKGIGLPSMPQHAVHRRLFVDDSAASKAARQQQLNENRSILDAVLADAKRVRGTLGTGDQAKLDGYLDSVRETERVFKRAGDFIDQPKPKVSFDPLSEQSIKELHQTYETVFHALHTDSCRVMVINLAPEISAMRFASLPGVKRGLHDLSHHGGDTSMLAQLAKVNTVYIKAFANFISKLAATKEGDGTMLDNTLVLHGSGLNNGKGYKNGSGQHDNTHLATLLAGGRGLGIKQGQFLRYEQEPLLSDLHLTMAKAMGLKIDSFGRSSGVLPGLI